MCQELDGPTEWPCQDQAVTGARRLYYTYQWPAMARSRTGPQSLEHGPECLRDRGNQKVEVAEAEAEVGPPPPPVGAPLPLFFPPPFCARRRLLACFGFARPHLFTVCSEPLGSRVRAPGSRVPPPAASSRSDRHQTTKSGGRPSSFRRSKDYRVHAPTLASASTRGPCRSWSRLADRGIDLRSSGSDLRGDGVSCVERLPGASTPPLRPRPAGRA